MSQFNFVDPDLQFFIDYCSENGIKISDIAEQLDIQSSNIYNYFKTGKINIATLKRYCQAIDKDLHIEFVPNDYKEGSLLKVIETQQEVIKLLTEQNNKKLDRLIQLKTQGIDTPEMSL